MLYLAGICFFTVILFILMLIEINSIKREIKYIKANYDDLETELRKIRAR